VPTLLRRAGLPPSLFQQEKIYVTTAEVFALWRSVAEMSRDPGFGLKLGTELRLSVATRCPSPVFAAGHSAMLYNGSLVTNN
jgi:hypothetical protein